ncbi:hypothetical protein AB6E18_25810, partial [Vibrio sp. 10N.247.311.46]|uniref:hypothetical protein n=1 Tax=Vibrio sp. 10N.247.311.46 TaxID=3229986 RepID=UPI00354F666B
LTAISPACWGKMKPTIEQSESVRLLHPTAVLHGTINTLDDAFFLIAVWLDGKWCVSRANHCHRAFPI